MCNSPLSVNAAMPSAHAAIEGQGHKSVRTNAVDTNVNAARESEVRLQSALDAAKMGVWNWDLITGEMSWSAQHYALFGLDIQQATGTYSDFAERIHPEDWEMLQQAVEHARETGADYQHEYRVIWPDGSLHWVAGYGRFLYDAEGNATRMTGVIMDATEKHWLLTQMASQMAQAQAALQEVEASRRQLEIINAQLAQANAQLEELITIDELTGLKNKRAFGAFLEQEFRAAVRYRRSLSVILLDVDRFKQINDKSGHPAGDAVLRRMGDLLQSHKRQIDMVARFGGEEFVYVLPDTDRQGAMAFAERVRTALEAEVWPEQSVTASFGVSTRTSESSDATDLIVQADRALYRSKRRGRNRVTHYADLS